MLTNKRPSAHPRSLLLLCCLCFTFLLSACSTGSGLLGGGNWQASGLQGKQFRTLTVDTGNQQLIYAGDTQGELYVSSDAGTDWSKRSTLSASQAAIRALAFDVAGKRLYLASAQGLYVSSDGGKQLSLVAQGGLPEGDYTALAFNLNAQKTVYLGSAHQGVFVSKDSGTTWSNISAGLPQDIMINSLVYDPNQRQMWAATSQGIYRSDDDGVAWHAFNTGLPAHIAVNSIEPASLNGGTKGVVYAGTAHGFYRSQDAGQHWAASQESLAGTSVHSLLLDFRDTSLQTIYAGTDIGVLRSTDGGQNWGAIAPGLPKKIPIYSMVLGASNYTQLFAAANDIYLYPGSTGGLSFARLWPFAIFALIFYLLYRVTRGRASRQRTRLQPPPQDEAAPPSVD